MLFGSVAICPSVHLAHEVSSLANKPNDRQSHYHRQACVGALVHLRGGGGWRGWETRDGENENILALLPGDKIWLVMTVLSLDSPCWHVHLCLNYSGRWVRMTWVRWFLCSSFHTTYEIHPTTFKKQQQVLEVGRCERRFVWVCPRSITFWLTSLGPLQTPPTKHKSQHECGNIYHPVWEQRAESLYQARKLV